MQVETEPAQCARPGCQRPAWAALTDEYGFETDPFCSVECRVWSAIALDVARSPWSEGVELASKQLAETAEFLDTRPVDGVL
jgi:hypothetical protein